MPQLPPLDGPGDGAGHGRRVRRRGPVAAGREHRRGARPRPGCGSRAARGRPDRPGRGRDRRHPRHRRHDRRRPRARGRAGLCLVTPAAAGTPRPRRRLRRHRRRPPSRAATAQVEAELGPIDLLVNNAGLAGAWGLFHEVPPEVLVARLRGEPARRRPPHPRRPARHGRARPRPGGVDDERDGERAEPYCAAYASSKCARGGADGAGRGGGRHRTASARSRWRPAW